jgi:hypothetical protein
MTITAEDAISLLRNSINGIFQLLDGGYTDQVKLELSYALAATADTIDSLDVAELEASNRQAWGICNAVVLPPVAKRVECQSKIQKAFPAKGRQLFESERAAVEEFNKKYAAEMRAVGELVAQQSKGRDQFLTVETPHIRQLREKMEAAKDKADNIPYGERGFVAAEREYSNAIQAHSRAVGDNTEPVEIPNRITTKWLRELAQDAGFNLNLNDELVVPAPHHNAEPYLRRLMKLVGAHVHAGASLLTDDEIMKVALQQTNPHAVKMYGDTFLRIGQAVLRQASEKSVGDDEQHIWIAYNSVDDDEAVMFFTELPGQEFKERFVLKHYLCRPAPDQQQ